MRRLPKIVISVAAVVLILVVIAAALVVWAVRRSFPEYEGTVALPGLQAEVEVIRDENGIPHIYADTAEDLFRAQGYVHAQDRFWEMEFRRHVTAGRLAELFGESQVETDVFLRTLGWHTVAAEEYKTLAPDTRRFLEAYASGVNAYLAERAPARLGLEFTLLEMQAPDHVVESWTPIDSLAWLKALAWDLRANMESEIERALLAQALPRDRVEQLFPDYPDDRHAPIVDDRYVRRARPAGRAATPALGTQAAEALAGLRNSLQSLPQLIGSGADVGSNSWVVAGSRTESGKPLLANDPHLAPNMPSIWYQVGLHCRTVSDDCPFDVAGFSFSGLPGVIIGHNDRIAWGFTNLPADVTDLYLERIEGDSYLVADEWVPLETRTERIEVAGGDPVTVVVRSTRHGPLLSDASEQLSRVGQAGVGDQRPQIRRRSYGVALRWTALDPGRVGDALFALNKARNWAEFRQAAALFDVPAQNLVYADVDGNIGYQAPGRIPIRRSGDGRWPAPGWDPAYDWTGYIPFEELPSVFNPEEGVIVTANQAVVGDAYPYHLTSDWDYGYRSQRIRQLLDRHETLTVDLIQDIQLDSWNAMAEVLVPRLLVVEGLEGYYADGQELLRDWDYQQTPDSAAAAYFNAVWANLLRLTLHDEVPADARPYGSSSSFEFFRALLQRPQDPFWDDLTTEAVETRDEILLRAMRDARDDLTQRLGKDPRSWSWGRLHALEIRNSTFGESGIGVVEALFNRGPYEVGGGNSTVLATGWNASEDYATVWVPSMRMVVDLADLDASRWVNLTGTSGHPYHRNYIDQVDLWQEGQTLPMRWSPEAVRRDAEHTLILTPTP